MDLPPPQDSKLEFKDVINMLNMARSKKADGHELNYIEYMLLHNLNYEKFVQETRKEKLDDI